MLRKFDVFPKLDNEYRIGTVSGGILSLLSIIFVAILSFVEIKSYLNPPLRQRLSVNSVRPTGADGRTITVNDLPRISIFINVTFPRTPCYLLHLDVIDEISQYPLPLEFVNSKFNRLGKFGNDIGLYRNIFNEDSMANDSNETCGDCHLNVPGKFCCNTCKSVYDINKERGTRLPLLSSVEQCADVKKKAERMNDEGCRIESRFRSVKVGGEFHIAPGISWLEEGWHIHNFEMFEYNITNLNLSHVIHRLQFSTTDEPMPLDNFVNIQSNSSYWRVTYTSDVLGNNFSVSKYSMYDMSKSPGIFFKYDVSPISAKTYYAKEPGMHLVTRLLTVVGGVLGIFRLIDSLCFVAHKKRAPKLNQ